jgi:adenylate cyclase
MAIEIERKFIISEIPAVCQPPIHIQQGYLNADPHRTIRIRISRVMNRPDKAYLTIKGAADPGHFARAEYEYEIPVPDAQEMLRLCQYDIVVKNRYHYSHEGVTWELDEFQGANAGLLIAEVELQDEKQEISLPTFLSHEITGHPEYFNLSLAKKPYQTWQTGGKHGDTYRSMETT